MITDTAVNCEPKGILSTSTLAVAAVSNRQAAYTKSNISPQEPNLYPKANPDNRSSPGYAGRGEGSAMYGIPFFRLVRYGMEKRKQVLTLAQPTQVPHLGTPFLSIRHEEELQLYEILPLRASEGGGRQAPGSTCLPQRSVEKRAERNAHARTTNKLPRKRIDHALTYPTASP